MKFKGKRRILWSSYNGRRTYIDEMDDMYLANVYEWVMQGRRSFRPAIVKTLNAEINKRKLTKAFLDRAPFPHQNENGEWILFIRGRPTVVGRGIR